MPRQYTPKVARVCRFCEAVFFVQPSVINRGHGLYCSAKCSHAFDPRRIWEKVDKSGECWEWTAALYSDGYGKVGFHGKTYRAHRAIWELTYGPVPEGMFVCHHCDNPLCVRPDHLFLGTQTDNMRDCASKGRISLQNVSPAERAVWQERGEKHHSARLTDDDIRAIRSRYAQGGISHVALALEYRVNRTTIGEIVRREIWRHVA